MGNHKTTYILVHGAWHGSWSARVGLVRHIGLSNVSPRQLAAAQAITEIVCIQNFYNVAQRGDDTFIDDLDFLLEFRESGKRFFEEPVFRSDQANLSLDARQVVNLRLGAQIVMHGVDSLLPGACVQPGTVRGAARTDFGHDDQIVGIRMEYFPKKMAEREAALVASPASGQDWDCPTPRDRIRFDSAQPRTEGIRPDKKANPIRRINDSISLYKLILCG
jgi:hypothetical protein